MTAHNLGPLDDLVDGELRRFDALGRNGLVLCNVQATIYAIDDNCTHADEPLSHGRLRGWHLTCALHGASFDVRSGQRAGLPVCPDVLCHQVSRVDGDVIVTIASS